MRYFLLLKRAFLACFLLTNRIILLFFLPILWQASISLLVTSTSISERISETDSSKGFIRILFVLPYRLRLLVEDLNATSLCYNFLHRSLKVAFSSCNLLIVTSLKLLIWSLRSVLTELISPLIELISALIEFMELVICCSILARASWKSPLLVLVLY